MSGEVFTIKINNGYYVDHGKKYFKRASSKKDAKQINGRGSLLSLLHTIYHSGVEFEELTIVKAEATDATN